MASLGFREEEETNVDDDASTVEDTTTADPRSAAVAAEATEHEGRGVSSSWRHLCGGTLITRKHILTAAHCYDDRTSPETYWVRLGDQDLEQRFDDLNVIETQVADMSVHPGYSYPRAYFDVAVVTLKESVHFTDFVLPVCLPTRASANLDEDQGKIVSLTGWGLRQRNDLKQVQALTRVFIGIFSQGYCNRTHDFGKGKSPFFRQAQRSLPELFQPNLLCAGVETGGVGSCPGDSGGPLVKFVTASTDEPYYEQVAVVHGGIGGCGDRNFPGIYTRVADPDVLRFIRTEADLITNTESESATVDSLPVDGGWSSWSPWRPCPTCPQQFQMTRSRSCSEPRPQNGGEDCQEGRDQETRDCDGHVCPHPENSDDVVVPVDSERESTPVAPTPLPPTWGAWGACVASCGGSSPEQGYRGRVRDCDAQAGSLVRYACETVSTRTVNRVVSNDCCQSEPCESQCFPPAQTRVDGGWSPWTPASACSLSCGTGTVEMQRTCNDPEPSGGGRPCLGASTSWEVCGSSSDDCFGDGGGGHRVRLASSSSSSSHQYDYGGEKDYDDEEGDDEDDNEAGGPKEQGFISGLVSSVFKFPHFSLSASTG